MISNYLRLVFLSPFSLFFLPTDSFMILSESKHLLVTFIWQPEKSEDVKKLLLIYLSSVSSFCCPLLYATLNYFALFCLALLHLYFPTLQFTSFTRGFNKHKWFDKSCRLQNLNLKCLVNQNRPSNLWRNVCFQFNGGISGHSYFKKFSNLCVSNKNQLKFW